MAQKHRALKNTAAIALVGGSLVAGAIYGWDQTASPIEKPLIETGPKGAKEAAVIQTMNSGEATVAAVVGGATGMVIGAGAWVGIDMLFLSRIRRKDSEDEDKATNQA